MKESPLTRGDFPIGMPSARGVFIKLCDILLNIPLFPPFLRGTFDTQIKNRTQAKRVIEHCLGAAPYKWIHDEKPSAIHLVTAYIPFRWLLSKLNQHPAAPAPIDS